MIPTPTVGRIVHFFASPGCSPEAAVIVAVHSDTCVNLSVCNSSGTWRSETSIVLDAKEGAGWSWPART